MTVPLVYLHKFAKVIIKALRKLIILSRIALNKTSKSIVLDKM